MGGFRRLLQAGSLLLSGGVFVPGWSLRIAATAGERERRRSVAWAIRRYGQKVLLPMALGSKESSSAWQSLIRDIQGRGLGVPVLIVTDCAPGLIRTVEEARPQSLLQRCLTNKIRNVMDNVPDHAMSEVKSMKSAYCAPNRNVAELIAQDLLDPNQNLYPSAIKAFTDDMEA